jgi:hypothetical protein
MSFRLTSIELLYSEEKQIIRFPVFSVASFIKRVAGAIYSVWFAGDG